jgi:peroxiredoxin
MPLESIAVPVGSEAPDFSLLAVDGTEFTLSAQRGNPVVLVFLRGFM